MKVKNQREEIELYDAKSNKTKKIRHEMTAIEKNIENTLTKILNLYLRTGLGEFGVSV